MSETLINGLHLFAAVGAIHDLNESIAFDDSDVELGDAYYAQTRTGSDNGQRRWKLTLPTLPHEDLERSFVTYQDRQMSREQYIRDLFSDTKVSGDPFVLQNPRTSQYYLVRFVDYTLSYQRMQTKLYSTGIELKQVRKDGTTVFAVDKVPTAAGGFDWHKGGLSGGGTQWSNSGSNAAKLLSVTGDVANVGSGLNGLTIVRLSGSSSTGHLNANAGWQSPCYDMFFVMKMREATFSNACGILTGSGGASVQILVGTNSGTKFQNFSISGMEYRKNGLLYAASNMQAPMNKWGIVHIRNKNGIDATAIQIGKDRTTAGTFAKADIAEIHRLSSLTPLSICREIVEHLATKWKIAG